MIGPRLVPLASVWLACVSMAAEAAVTVERAVVPLTHEAVARAYHPNFGGPPRVGDPAAPEADRWADLFFRYHFTLENDGTQPATVQAAATKPADFAAATEFRLEPEKVEIAPGKTAGVTLVVKVPGEAAAKLPAGYSREIAVRFAGDGVADATHKVVFWVPAVAKILAGADGTGVPADVLPANADYADEFAGGWDGTKFKQPFLVLTARQMEARRKMVAEGFKPQHNLDYPYPKADLGQNPDFISIKMQPDGPSIANDVSGGMFDLALHWAYTGDRKYAEKVRELAIGLLDRADRLGLAKARLGQNPLSEAWATAPIFMAFDMVSGAGVFKPDEEKRFREWMRWETTLMRQIFAYSNQQCEENIANLCGGLLLGNWQDVRFAYYPPYGSEGQLSGAFYADGFHREHQVGYHYRSIIPICEQAEALLRLGFCAYDERIHRALMQPVRASMLPGEDLGGGDFAVCELAWLRYHDPLAAEWLRLTRRRTRMSLGGGGSPLPEASGLYWKKGGSHMPGCGETVLRSPDGRCSVAFGWGRPEKRGAHDFMDYRLLYSDGQRAFVFGAGQFGIVETFAHNSIVVNEGQAATPGVPVEMALGGEFPYVVAENPGPKADESEMNYAQPWPYPWIWPHAGDSFGINWPAGLPRPNPDKVKLWREWRPMPGVSRWSRTVALVEDGYLIADAVALDAAGRVDRAVAVGGGLTPQATLEGVSVPLVPAAAPLGKHPAYLAAQSSTLRGFGSQSGSDGGEAGFPRATTADSWSFAARMGNAGVTATMLGAPGTEVIQVNWLKGSWGNANPFMIARREGVKDTRFIVFIEPYGTWAQKSDAGPRLKGLKRVPVTDAGGKPLADDKAAAVELDFGDKRVVVLLNDGGGEIKAGGVGTGKRFAAARVK